MLMFAKITDSKTNKCMVGNGTNIKFYKKIGMEKMEVEQAYTGDWYVAGYAPEKPQEIINIERITELKSKLSESDYAIIKIAEGAATAEEYADLITQRAAWRAEINELEKNIE